MGIRKRGLERIIMSNFRYRFFTDDKLSYEFQIDDISNEWDVYGFHRLGATSCLSQ